MYCENAALPILKQELHIAKPCYQGLVCAAAWSYLLNNSLKKTEINRPNEDGTRSHKQL